MPKFRSRQKDIGPIRFWSVDSSDRHIISRGVQLRAFGWIVQATVHRGKDGYPVKTGRFFANVARESSIPF